MSRAGSIPDVIKIDETDDSSSCSSLKSPPPKNCLQQQQDDGDQSSDSDTSQVSVDHKHTRKRHRSKSPAAGVNNQQEIYQSINILTSDRANPPSGATINNNNPLVEIAKVNFRDFCIGIFTDRETSPSTIGIVNQLRRRRFYFEPIAVLDPESVSIESAEAMLNPDFVRFKIQMWTQRLRDAVLDRLRTLPGLYHIQEDDVYVLPFEEVQLVCKPGSIAQSIKLMDKPKSYLRLNETLDFFFECDSLSTAYILAEKLRSIPLFLLEKWELALECRGLTLPRNEPSAILQNSPIFKFSLSAEPAIQPSTMRKTDQLNESRNKGSSWSTCGTERVYMEERLKDFEDQNNGERLKDLEDKHDSLQNFLEDLNIGERLEDLEECILKRRTSNEVQVFSVWKCTNPTAESDTFLTFASMDFETDSKYGDFDLATGLFTVKTGGTYQFKFSGHVGEGANYISHRVVLRGVDGNMKAAVTHSATSLKVGGYQPILLSAHTPLKTGEMIGICRAHGKLYDDGHEYGTRFSCIFLAAEEKKCDW